MFELNKYQYYIVALLPLRSLRGNRMEMKTPTAWQEACSVLIALVKSYIYQLTFLRLLNKEMTELLLQNFKGASNNHGHNHSSATSSLTSSSSTSGPSSAFSSAAPASAQNFAYSGRPWHFSTRQNHFLLVILLKHVQPRPIVVLHISYVSYDWVVAGVIEA